MPNIRQATRSRPSLGAASGVPDTVAMIAPLDAFARYSLRLCRDAAISGGEIAGLMLDIAINTCIVAGEFSIARLGPVEWTLHGPAERGEFLEHEVDLRLTGQVFSLVDIGHRDISFAVKGPFARQVINGGCPLDLDDCAFPAGSATRTVLGKAEIVLLRPGVELNYLVECRRSFGPYVYGFLSDIAREFEPL